MAHQDDDQMFTLADLAQIVDSPMMRAMGGELTAEPPNTRLEEI